MARVPQIILASLGVIVALVTPTDAFAYVDAGTGAYLLQVGVSVVGTVMFYLSRPHRLLDVIKAMLRSKRKPRDE